MNQLELESLGSLPARQIPPRGVVIGVGGRCRTGKGWAEQQTSPMKNRASAVRHVGKTVRAQLAASGRWCPAHWPSRKYDCAITLHHRCRTETTRDLAQATGSHLP